MGCTKIPAASIPLGSKSLKAGIELQGHGVGTGISVLSTGGEGWAAKRWKNPAGSGIPSCVLLAFNPVLVPVSRAAAQPAPELLSVHLNKK